MGQCGILGIDSEIKMEKKELIFVYNADSGLWNSYMDIMHKVFSPKTYSCNLCAITHGTFSIKNEWANFIKELPLPLTFLHRDEWKSSYQLDDVLPAIFLKENDGLSVWLAADKLDQMSLEELKEYITENIKTL